MLLASLVQPAFGLIFWMTLSFGIVFFLLAKFAWKPILKALHERERSIEDAIGEAKRPRGGGRHEAPRTRN
jgi:F-type H+-transporting ATPase subunit b